MGGWGWFNLLAGPRLRWTKEAEPGQQVLLWQQGGNGTGGHVDYMTTTYGIVRGGRRAELLQVRGEAVPSPMIRLHTIHGPTGLGPAFFLFFCSPGRGLLAF